MGHTWRSRNVLRAAAGFSLLTLLMPVGCKKAEEKVKEEAAYVVGMEEYVYGFPLVMSDVTRQVLTAVPRAGELSAPINQVGKMRGYVPWNWYTCVRVSFNSL